MGKQKEQEQKMGIVRVEHWGKGSDYQGWSKLMEGKVTERLLKCSRQEKNQD